MEDPHNSKMRRIWGEDFAGYEFSGDNQAAVFVDIGFFLIANPTYIVTGTSFEYDETERTHYATVVVSTGMNKKAR
jgi:hypothetical protein